MASEEPPEKEPSVPAAEPVIDTQPYNTTVLGLTPETNLAMVEAADKRYGTPERQKTIRFGMAGAYAFGAAILIINFPVAAFPLAIVFVALFGSPIADAIAKRIGGN